VPRSLPSAHPDVPDMNDGNMEPSRESDTEITRCSHDTISRKAAIDALNEQIEQCNKALGSFDISLKDEFAIKVERASLEAYKEQLENLPSVQPEITHEQAIDYLHETGWLQNHDRILTESKEEMMLNAERGDKCRIEVERIANDIGINALYAMVRDMRGEQDE